MSVPEAADFNKSGDRACETPQTEYARRLRERQQQLTRIENQHRILWIYIIGAALAAVGLLYAPHSPNAAPRVWLLLPLTVALSSAHSLAKNARICGQVARMVRFYAGGLARLAHEWQGQGIGGEDFRPEDHTYANDLDLFGSGSMFEFLCTARTGVGRSTLATWLLEPAPCVVVAERQAAVAELRNQLDFREDWASVRGSALDQPASGLRDWAIANAAGFPGYLEGLAIVLPAFVVLLSFIAWTGLLGHYWFLAIAVAVGLEAVLSLLFLKKTRRVGSDLVLPSFELTTLAPLLARMENAHFHAPLLKSLQLKLRVSGKSPVERIRRLQILVWLLELRQFEYFAAPASLILWGTNLSIFIDRWRQQNREALLGWLEALGQFEALLCLSRYFYENPDCSFPILNPAPSPLFRAEGLGHPLLKREACVRCDIALGTERTQLFMVSGSNMSGKSTLLRSVGLNAALALAGAPVHAIHMEVSHLQIGCSIDIHDSLRHGKSRFRAEVERLKWILDWARAKPVLFLFDEVLSGTNSTDRLWGTKAVIDHLAKSGAVGLITTHDLALTEIVNAFPGRASNVHFEEHYENGEMHFDYRMRPGVLTRTNGVNVMAALGIL